MLGIVSSNCSRCQVQKFALELKSMAKQLQEALQSIKIRNTGNISISSSAKTNLKAMQALKLALKDTLESAQVLAIVLELVRKILLSFYNFLVFQEHLLQGIQKILEAKGILKFQSYQHAIFYQQSINSYYVSILIKRV